MSEQNLYINLKGKGINEKITLIASLVNWLCHEMQYGRVNNNNLLLKQETANLRTPLSIAFVKMVEKGEIDEVTASENASLFLEWNSTSTYNMGELRNYGGKLYKCLQSHTGQTDWAPDKATSLWKECGVTESGIMEWSQPISSADAYMIGDEVMYNGEHYKSVIDNNVWSPETYPQGWEIVTEEVAE